MNLASRPTTCQPEPKISLVAPERPQLLREPESPVDLRPTLELQLAGRKTSREDASARRDRLHTLA